MNLQYKSCETLTRLCAQLGTAHKNPASWLKLYTDITWFSLCSIVSAETTSSLLLC